MIITRRVFVGDRHWTTLFEAYFQVDQCAHPIMLRRVPTTADGKALDRMQESVRLNRPFKLPTLASAKTAPPLRKRKRISYKERDHDGSDSEVERAKKKQKKNMDKDGVYHNEEELLAAIPKYPVYHVKPFSEVGSRRFSLPTMRTKDGAEIPLLLSHASLGVRPQAKVIPRPLHDPMEDHAIVLYDPTIDDRETDEERKEREKDEAKEREAKEAKEKTAGLYNPHKSLKSLLGEGADKVKLNKVPVVIDPRLSKVLRPHQIEGVKVRAKVSLPLAKTHALHTSSCTNARRECLWTINMAVLWLTRWGWGKLCSVLHFYGPF